MFVRPDHMASDVQALLHLVAEPVRPGERVTEQIRRVARRCSLTYSRARKLWYAEASPSAVDLVSILQAITASNDALVAYQSAKATLLRQQLDAARAGA